MRAPRFAPVSLALSSLVIAVVAASEACVPPGNAVPEDSGAPATQASAAPVFVPSVGVMTEVFFDDFERKPSAPDAESPSPAGAPREIQDAQAKDAARSADASSDAGPKESKDAQAKDGKDGAAPLPAQAQADAGRGHKDPHGEPVSTLGPDWTQAKTNAWRIENGWLCGQGAKNHGVWLNRVLPINARIEFDARSESGDGDLKTEVWGDGQSAATTVSYTNATSYLAILGGWKNTIHVLARINEHGTDRHELHVDKESDDARKRPVAPGQSYHFKVERTDGKTVRWSVNGAEMHSFSDPQPLQGNGHDHFGFNDWDAKVCFDNVRVTPL